MGEHSHGSMQMSAASKRPSGHVQAAPSSGGNSKPPDDPKDQNPWPVFLHTATIIKMSIGVLLAIGAAISPLIYQFASTRQHIETKEIHVRAESKTEAKEARKYLLNAILEKQEIKIREVKVDQREQIQKLGADLKREQRAILREVVRARRAAER